MTAQTGKWGFAPQVAKGSTPDPWYLHAALAVDGGVNDEATVGPPEISGVPVPTAPHKTGYSNAGMITYQPRFENVLGWLMHGAMGDYDGGDPDFDENYLFSLITLTGAPQVAYTTGMVAIPVLTGRRVSVTVQALGGANFSGAIDINGTDLADAPLSETLTFVDAALYAILSTTAVFKTITSVDLPAYETNGDKLSVGYESGVAHLFKFLAADQAAVKWMGIRKYIPQVDGGANTDLLETYTDCKMLGFMLNVINRGLLTAQTAFVGRDFVFSNDEPGDWDNTVESYNSMPVSVKTDGYVRLAPESLALTDQNLKVINAQIGLQNVPVPMQVDRVYADPRLFTLEIASRITTFNVTLRWTDPEFYRAVVTHSLTGTVWSEVPLVGAVDFRALSIDNMPGETQPYGLRIQAPKVMMALARAVPLIGNQVVLATYRGVAIDNPTGEYCTMTLRNKQAAGAYAWPT